MMFRLACLGYIVPEYYRWPGDLSPSLGLKQLGKKGHVDKVFNEAYQWSPPAFLPWYIFVPLMPSWLHCSCIQPPSQI